MKDEEEETEKGNGKSGRGDTERGDTGMSRVKDLRLRSALSSRALSIWHRGAFSVSNTSPCLRVPPSPCLLIPHRSSFIPRRTREGASHSLAGAESPDGYVRETRNKSCAAQDGADPQA
jgi:hypothetical protein